MSSDFVHLPANTNQALGIAEYAIDFMKSGSPDESVLERTRMFHTDACLCGLSALALGTNAPNVLRDEALGYPVGDDTLTVGTATQKGASVFGSAKIVSPRRRFWPMPPLSANGIPTARTSATTLSGATQRVSSGTTTSIPSRWLRHRWLVRTVRTPSRAWFSLTRSAGDSLKFSA